MGQRFLTEKFEEFWAVLTKVGWKSLSDREKWSVNWWFRINVAPQTR